MILIYSIFSLLFIIIFLKYFALKFKLVDIPNHRKMHKGVVPVIGGIAIYINFLIYVYLFSTDKQLLTITFITGIIVFIGLLDDRGDLPVIPRLTFQLIITLLMIGSGIYVADIGEYLFFSKIELGFFSILISVFAIMGLTNAINFIDGVDGLCSGIVILALITMLFFCKSNNTFDLIKDINLYYLLILSIIIFFILNFFTNKFKIFLGDNGSIFLGFILSSFLIYFTQPNNNFFHPCLVFWCVPLPILDLLSVTIRRMLRRKNPFKPDRRHIHHLLLDLKFKSRLVVFLLLLFSSFVSFIGYGVYNLYGSLWSLVMFVIILIYYIIFSIILSRYLTLKLIKIKIDD